MITPFEPSQPSKVTTKSKQASKAKPKKTNGASKSSKPKTKTKTKAMTKTDRKAQAEAEAEKFWEKKTALFENPNNSKTFNEFIGVARETSSAKTPLEFFNLFFTDEIWDQIITESNRYHDQYVQNDNWKPISKEEIMAFIGVTIAMGIINLPELEQYWRKDGICNIPWFSTVMTYTRYKAILKFIHLVDKENLPHKDSPDYKLYKLGGIHLKLNDLFAKLYFRSQELSIDEQMVGTRCCIGFIQYMTKKPTKFGIKIWVLAEAHTGYCQQFQIYTGKSNDGQENGLTYRVCTDLLTPTYLNKNHHVYFDNYFTTIHLMQDLASNSTFTCGTIRSDRGRFPASFTAKGKLERGESEFRCNNNNLAVRWKDKRDVYVVSTIHGNSIKQVQRRGEEEPVSKPTMICQYNSFMNGVDKCDQKISSYDMQRKTRKWWKKLFLRLVELSIINAMVILITIHADILPVCRRHRVFRTVLIHELVQPLIDIDNDNVTSKRQTNTNATRLRGRHFPSSKHLKRGACSVCAYKRGKDGKQSRKKTSQYCKKCGKIVLKATTQKVIPTRNITPNF
ncbi:piggyBac transposable element-derived protein 4-like [Clytia hemisphaerica]|uniref:piggyBac transposable element-derived protein 4-like n=1 Tax=Clytia hemisphaerica TaxID=252671 RepID=UPI0034D66A5B